MPELPLHGWFFRCKHCDVVTSRESLVYLFDEEININICLSCRRDFILALQERYNMVEVLGEAVAIQIIRIH